MKKAEIEKLQADLAAKEKEALELRTKVAQLQMDNKIMKTALSPKKIANAALSRLSNT